MFNFLQFIGFWALKDLGGAWCKKNNTKLKKEASFTQKNITGRYTLNYKVLMCIRHFVNQHPTSQQTFHIPHPTSGTSHIPHIPHPEHPISRTSHIPNIPHLQHPTSPTSRTPNIPHPEHPTSLTSHIPNIQYPQNSTYGQQSKSNTRPFIVWFVDIFGKDFWK